MIPWPRLIQAESEVNVLQQKVEAQQLTTEKDNKQAEEVVHMEICEPQNALLV